MHNGLLIIWVTEDAATCWTCVTKSKRLDGHPLSCYEGAPVSVSWVPEMFLFPHFCGSFTWRRSKLTGLFFCHFLFFTRQEERKKKDNHPAVCMTRKHQLKTIRCIPYYFMLGWNLSACINSLYKLKTGGFRGRPLCWGSQCGSVFRRVVVSFRGCDGSRAQSPSSCIVVPTVRDEDKEAAQARLCFAEFSGWVLGAGGMIPC